MMEGSSPCRVYCLLATGYWLTFTSVGSSLGRCMNLGSMQQRCRIEITKVIDSDWDPVSDLLGFCCGGRLVCVLA